MKQPDSGPIASVEVSGATAEAIELLSQLGQLPDEGIPHNGNGKLLVSSPSPEEAASQLQESLSTIGRAKREVERSHSLRRASSFNTAYCILLLEQLRTVTRARNVSLYRPNRDATLLEPTLWLGDWLDDEKPRSYRRGQGICGTAWERREVYVSKGNVQNDPHFDASINDRSKDVRSLLAVPIVDFEEHLIGVLNLDSNVEDRFSLRLKERLEALQPDVYAKLQELELVQLADEELILIFFWILHKAIAPSYIMAPQRAGMARVQGAAGTDSAAAEEALLKGEPPSSPVAPAYVDEVFSAIRADLSPGVGKPGPSPIRLDRLRAVFHRRENEWISLDEFATAFADSTEPRKSASSAVSWLNNILRRWGYDLTIETTYCTAYRLRLRAPK